MLEKSMHWTVKVSRSSAKALERINAPDRKKLIEFIEETLPNLENPRTKGKELKGKLKGYWRYRVGNYRLICEIQDGYLIIVVVDLGHRQQVYK